MKGTTNGARTLKLMKESVSVTTTSSGSYVRISDPTAVATLDRLLEIAKAGLLLKWTGGYLGPTLVRSMNTGVDSSGQANRFLGMKDNGTALRSCELRRFSTHWEYSLSPSYTFPADTYTFTFYYFTEIVDGGGTN